VPRRSYASGANVARASVRARAGARRGVETRERQNRSGAAVVRPVSFVLAMLAIVHAAACSRREAWPAAPLTAPGLTVRPHEVHSMLRCSACGRRAP
jgi:hypothetical protein